MKQQPTGWLRKPLRITEHDWPEGTVPIVSVCSTTYNHEKFVEQCIEGLLAQETIFPVEIVIHDDYSTDHTADIIRAYHARYPRLIRPILQTENQWSKGRSALAIVLSSARGEHITICEGDDYWISPAKVQRQLDLLRKKTNAIGVFHPVAMVDEDGSDTGKMWPDYPVTEVSTKDLLRDDPIPTVSVMVRRSALKSLPERFRRLKTRDWPMWVFASLDGRWICLPEAMAAYRQHGGGIWNSLDVQQRRAITIELFDAFAAELPPPFATLALRRLAKLNLDAHLAALEAALKVGERAEARSEWRAIMNLAAQVRWADSRRLVSALCLTFLPRTHRAIKRMQLWTRSVRKKSVPAC